VTNKAQELVSRQVVYLCANRVLLQLSVETFSPYTAGGNVDLDGKPYAVAEIGYQLRAIAAGGYMEAQLVKLIEAAPMPDLTQEFAQSSMAAKPRSRTSALTLPQLVMARNR
jgi:hypothetical protein